MAIAHLDWLVSVARQLKTGAKIEGQCAGSRAVALQSWSENGVQFHHRLRFFGKGAT